MRFAGLAGAVVLLVMGIGSFGYLYDHHLAPLARLAGEIEVGDPFNEVHRKFVTYYEQARSPESMDFTARDSTTGKWTTDVTTPASGLYLSDRGLFDDIRLTVEFDAEGNVERITLVAD